MPCCCQNGERMKAKPRSEKEVKDLTTRLNRIIGQLSGIKGMIEEGRYCGDILLQVAASEKALEKVGLILLKTHMRTCVSDDLKKGDEGVIEETISLIERLK